MPFCQSAAFGWIAGEAAAMVVETYFDGSEQDAHIARTVASAAVGAATAVVTVDPAGGVFVAGMLVDNAAGLISGRNRPYLQPTYNDDKLFLPSHS